ncbi:capsular exopolysaccharide synthesis family protein [Arcticibacter tournemirensis]|uniref:Polysaccharide biosynthesis tyrosine autokinase n=1 Tax=Arcticibacter tournemirensis TaxID=699437 RepID=A0A5M9H503_9SPHI|nr:polysaccharide biosynthesis tyrosine autokinase [Arcticibacter tournemirensis]KAA8482022.1 polysaccharide biosynthesis tyrosine autokinase [Arcticibacter tournemirensis]TQM49426.1 capsular exopolysaccharide synthesis family protein [Arcticibacter tournemirensis]
MYKSSINKAESRKDENDELKLFLSKLLSQWPLFILSILTCLGIGILFLRYKTPVYKIAAKLLVEDQQKGGAGMGTSEMFSDLGTLFNTKSNVDNEAEILRTRSLVEEIVRNLKLNVRYYKKGTFKNLELYDAPFNVELISVKDTVLTTTFEVTDSSSGEYVLSYEDRQTGDEISKKYRYDQAFIIDDIGTLKITKNAQFRGSEANDYIFTIASFDQTVASIRAQLAVAVTNKQVSTIDLTLEYPIPKKGEEILTEVINSYIKLNLRNRNEIADSTIAFIENRLLVVSRELGDIEGNIQKFKQTKGLADISEQSKLLVGSSSEYIKRISDIETQLNITEALLGYLKDESRNKRVVPSSVLPEDPVFAGLVERYNNLVLEKERHLLSSTEDNPVIRNLVQRIMSLRNDMLSNLNSTAQSLRITKQQLNQNAGQIQGQIKAVPSQERTYLDLARQQEIKQELYVYLLQKREETAISKTANLANTRLIDAAKSETAPFSPKRGVLLLMSLAFGLALPVGWIYLNEILNNRIQNKKEIEYLTSIPIIGEISHNSSEENVVVIKNSRSPISEQFRALRTNLPFFMASDATCQTILLTSSMSGEGKSFIATNLGAALALSGKKVAMLELDLRKPKLSQNLGVVGKYGFTNYIIDNNVKESDIISATWVNENLFVVSAGPIPPNPAETILNSRMDSLIKYLKDQFDFIILDAPPIGLVSDAQLLSKYADLSLYIVRQRITYKDQLMIANELYDNGKFGKMAIVVNDISKSKGYGYGYGYGYAYGYSYGEYNDMPSPNFWNRITGKK